jgi:hypothetical protein
LCQIEVDSPRIARPRVRFLKFKLGGSNTHRGASLQLGFIDLLIVDVGAISTLRIPNPPRAFPLIKRAVNPGTEWITQYDVTVRPPPDAIFLARVQYEVGARPSPVDHGEIAMHVVERPRKAYEFRESGSWKLTKVHYNGCGQSGSQIPVGLRERSRNRPV